MRIYVKSDTDFKNEYNLWLGEEQDRRLKNKKTECSIELNNYISKLEKNLIKILQLNYLL